MEVRENGQEMNAFLTNERFGRGISVMNAGNERGEGVVAQGPSNGLELCNSNGESISVGEFVEARNDPLLKIKGRPGGGSGLGRTQREALGGKN